jgi:hypothetical protein
MSCQRVLQEFLIAFHVPTSPFFVNIIPNSNLLLIVINKINDISSESMPTDGSKMTTEPIEMETQLQYGVVHPCHKLYMAELERRRLDECYVSWLNCCAMFYVFIYSQ